MRYTGRYSKTEDDYDVSIITNEECDKAIELSKNIKDSTESDEDYKIVLRNVINTLIEQL